MPLIKSAIKKMRQDKAREKTNRVKKDALKKILKKFHTEPNQSNLSSAFSGLDKAVKIGLIPKGRANRKKSRLNKKVTSTKTTVKTGKKSSTKPKK
jgi:ribosomal protein S20